MKTVWITGAAGLIGGYLCRHIRNHAPEWRVREWTHSELDLTDFGELEIRFRTDSPELLIHCAAMTKIADCEAQPELARKINVAATDHLAALASEKRLVFLSTDLVFDGKKGGYIETDPANPITFYGETKAAAEQTVLRHPRHLVVRTSINLGQSRRGQAYNEQQLAAWRAGAVARLFVDEYRSPIAAVVTARAVWELALGTEAGVYHVAGSERLSRFEMGRLLAARHPEVIARIEPCSLREFSGPPRAPDTTLNCGKAQRLLSFLLPGLTQWLADNLTEPI